MCSIRVFIITPIYDICVKFHIVISIIIIRAGVIIAKKIIVSFSFDVRWGMILVI